MKNPEEPHHLQKTEMYFLRFPLSSPGEEGKHCQGNGLLEDPNDPACHRGSPPDEQAKMEDGYQIHSFEIEATTANTSVDYFDKVSEDKLPFAK